MSVKPENVLLMINQRRLAEKLDISQQAVQQWVASGVVPPERVLEVEKITGISRNRLNPKIYPD